MPAKDIGIDLGTRNSLVFSTGRGIVLREPSVVIYDKDTEKIRAIGEEARQMASHLTSNMEVIWPIRGGVIVDYNVMEKMLKYFISQAMGRRAFRKPRVSISVPSGITEIERKAMEDCSSSPVPCRLWRKQHISPEPGKYFSWKNLLRLRSVRE